MPKQTSAIASPAAGRPSDRVKQVPPLRADRERLRRHAEEVAARLDRSQPLSWDAIEIAARQVVADLGMAEGFVGWTMVAVASAFWREQVVAVPFDRRLLLLPHCLRDADRCPATYDADGLWCQDCGACHLSALRAIAQEKGYQVLIAEGSPKVLKLILAGKADAILGVACLDALEKSLEKILLAGIPCMAVPLLAATCRNTACDEDWVRQMIQTPYRPGPWSTRTYLHLLRTAAGLFERAELDRLVPRRWAGPSLAELDGQGLAGLQPVAATEAVARDFLVRGGKHYRPFITLAAYDVMTGGRASGQDGAAAAAQLPDAVKRIALAIEVFHKASLVHDDIEDDDAFRYGRPALHRVFGTPMAINIGDYLVGLGYRLVAEQAGLLSPAIVADLVGIFSRAHTRLCEGQGAELAWARLHTKRLSPLEALKIYAMKTAPAFEAALLAGLRLAGPIELYAAPAAQFARHLGVGFQILNDLDDWKAQPSGKQTAAGDALAARPTLLWALAMQRLHAQQQIELDHLVRLSPSGDGFAAVRARELYERAGAFTNASQLLARHRRAARNAADRIACAKLRRLLHYFVDSILPRTDDEPP